MQPLFRCSRPDPFLNSLSPTARRAIRSKLSTASETIEQWLTVQNMWMYMEAVFSGGDIVKQLPQEAKRFQNIDKNFMKASCRGGGAGVALVGGQMAQGWRWSAERWRRGVHCRICQLGC